MGGSAAEQGAFGWIAEQAAQERAELSEAEERSGAPPAVGGGGARSAVRSKVSRAERPRPVPTPEAVPLPPDNELWDVHAAARFLKRSVSWVYHKAEDGTLPVKRLGGWGLRFVPADLRTWVDRGAPGKRG